MNQALQDRMTAASTTSSEKANTWSLVLWAMNIFHEVIRNEQGYHLQVREVDLKKAQRQLAAFEEENSNWPSPREDQLRGKVNAEEHPPIILIMGSLLLIYAITGPWIEHGAWFRYGAVNGEEILHHGQWWRLITALTLHSNPVHLLGNMLIGGFLLYFLLRTVGSGLGLTLLLLCGGLGNYINILFHGPAHTSVGFSTAVFAAIGILTGRQCIHRKNMMRTMLPPLAAGVGLLAMLGASGEQTDVGAHLFGLVAGLLAGAALTIAPKNEKLIANRSLQTALFIFSLSFVTLCWLMAFNT
jgi:membrane associated rhomboid family serine protease